MADFSKRGPGCGDGERGERGKRGHRGPRGHVGATGPTGPAAAETVGPFPSPSITTKIYAREDGDDVDGDGSLGNPYRTYLRASQDIPRQILPGNFVIVDITGSSSDANPEILPPNYAVPAPCSPYPTEFRYVLPNSADYYPFTTVTALEIIAKPQLATLTSGSNNLSAGDFTTSFDPDTNLIAVQTNQTYDASVIGKMVQDGIGLRGVVWHRALGIGGDILYLTSAQMQDMFPLPGISVSDTPPIPPTVGFPVGTGGFLQIVQQSAAFQTSKAPNSIVAGGFMIAGACSFGIRGINIQLAPGQGGLDTEVWSSSLVFLEGMQLDGLVIAHSSETFVANSIIHDGFFDLVDTSAGWFAMLFNRVGFIAPSLGPGSIVGLGFVFDTCTAFGPRYDFAQPVGRGAAAQVGLRDGFITNSIADANLGQLATQENFPAPFLPGSLNPALQMPGYGIVAIGGNYFVDHVKIIGAQSDAIHYDGVGSLELRSVTGGEFSIATVFTDIPNAANGGFGLLITDGGQARVSDTDGRTTLPPDPFPLIATSVNAGQPSEISVGSLAPTTWTAFYALTPTNLPDFAGSAATGARLFKP